MATKSYIITNSLIENLISDVHQFYEQDVYENLGSSISNQRPIFRLIFSIVRIASKSCFLNMILVAAVILGYRLLREPNKDTRIFQYGMSENNIAAFKRLNQCLSSEIVNGISINGRRIPFHGRLKAVLSLRCLWQVAGLLTAQRHLSSLAHLQSVLAVAGAVTFSVRPMDDRLQVVCVANDHFAICMALMAAARQQKKATCYLQHAPVTEHFPPLDYDLSILFDRRSVDAYRKAAQRRAVPFNEDAIVLLPPFAEEFRDPQAGSAPYRIGICLSLLPDVQKINEKVCSLTARTDVAAIYLRRHPRCRQNWSTIAALQKVELRTQNEAAVDFFAKVDIALVPNSGVAIESMHYGRPTFFLPGMDALPHDYYGFVSAGVLPNFSIKVFDAPTAFFDSAWKSRFKSYDETVFTSLTSLRAEVEGVFTRLLFGYSQ